VGGVGVGLTAGGVLGVVPELVGDRVPDVVGGAPPREICAWLSDFPPPEPLPHEASVATASETRTLINRDFGSTICSRKRTAMDCNYRNHVTLISKSMRR